MLPGGRPPGPPPRRGGSGLTPLRLFFLALLAATAFLIGHSTGRSSGLATCSATAAAGGAPRDLLAAAPAPAGCPLVEPCKCDCLGNPDRKLIDAGPKKPLALPFNVGKDTKYQHVSAEAEGDEQHKGGGGGAAAAAASNPQPVPPQEEAPPPAAPEAPAAEVAQPAAPLPEAPAGSFMPPPKPMADSGKPPAFLAAMFRKEHGGAAGGAGGSEPAAAAAPEAPGSSSSAGTAVALTMGPAAGTVADQCSLPVEYRGLLNALAWVDRPIVDAAFMLVPGKHASEHKVGKVRVQSTLYPGSRSALGGNDIWHLVTRNDWDPNCARALRETLTARPGAHVIDVGAWIGTATLLAGVLGAGKVLALEPDPLAFEELWANVRLNPDLAARTWVYRHCASDRSETATIKSVVGSTAYLLDGWDAKTAGPGEVEAAWGTPCSTIPALAAAHGMTPASVGLLRISAAQPGMELYIGKTVLDWALSTPEGMPKPGVWLTLHAHKWGDKALGHHVLMPLVRAYKYQYDTWLNPVDLELAERKGEGPCPKEHGICTIWLTDIPMSS